MAWASAGTSSAAARSSADGAAATTRVRSTERRGAAAQAPRRALPWAGQGQPRLRFPGVASEVTHPVCVSVFMSVNKNRLGV